ncbi:hypothetical protein ACP6PL_08355 [Dapis sp. BLCC M126]|uniref:hypothetical protein n=1 Tax=Dapis sp. BLCC M126 TaxID=3400189 RepID=UPI003CFBA39C
MKKLCMKDILSLIEHKQVEFRQHPLYQFLRNKNIAPRRRLAFAPCFAFFVMGFAELNQYAFREEPTDDPIQKIVNQHTYEDDCHWPWFLEDLEKLGMNYSLKFTSCLKYLWNQDNKFSRSTIYKLYKLGYKAEPIQKLAMIEAIEAIADIFLGATAEVCQELQSFSDENYPYFGQHHFTVDTSHTIYSSELKQFIENIQIPEQIETSVRAAVDEVFDIFVEFSTSLLEYAQNYSSTESLKDMSLLDEFKVLTQQNQYQVKQQIVASPIMETDALVPSNFKPLGTYLLEAGLLTSDQLTIALSEQQQNPSRLGEIVAQRGWVNQQTVEYMMEKLIIPEREIPTKSL